MDFGKWTGLHRLSGGLHDCSPMRDIHQPRKICAKVSKSSKHSPIAQPVRWYCSEFLPYGSLQGPSNHCPNDFLSFNLFNFIKDYSIMPESFLDSSVENHPGLTRESN